MVAEEASSTERSGLRFVLLRLEAYRAKAIKEAMLTVALIPRRFDVA